MTAAILWLIGWGFSYGYMGVDKNKKIEAFLCGSVLFMAWPFVLGSWIRYQAKCRDGGTDDGETDDSNKE